MRKKIKVYNKINVRILAMLLILFSITVIIVSVVNRNNIRRLYEENFTERVLVTNALMASVINNDDVEYFIDLMKNQTDSFKKRQVQFYYERNELRELIEKGSSSTRQEELWDSLTAFYNELVEFKTAKYWDTVKELKKLKEVSRSTYLYVMGDTGLFTDEGEVLYMFIFDADDDETAYNTLGIEESIYIDGLGTSDVSVDSIKTVYSTKKQMEQVEYYNDVYGELYYAYAPILNGGGDVIAVLGTDLDLENMNNAIAASALLFNSIFLGLFALIIFCIFIFLQSSITKPLSGLTDTAYELAEGNIYSATPETALKQQGEIGMLANAINDMSATYQEMIKTSGKLFDAAYVGKLDVRNDADKFKGAIKNVMNQINNTLDSIAVYLNCIPEGIIIMSSNHDTYFRNEHFIKFFGDISASEFVSLVNNNTTVWINDMCYTIIFKEIENSLLGIAVDITDLMKEKEKAQAAAEAKSSFLSRMSHEMRTPMNAIIGMAKIAEGSEDVSKLKYCLSTIGASSGHLLSIINDVLDMSKIEAGKFEFENVPMNIEKTLMKVCSIFIDNMEKKGQKFNVILSKDLNLNYIADDLRISQVITNLLSNAVKFTPENGEITLTVENAGQVGNINTLRFSVTDTGIGMTENQIARLFNAFEQADGSVSRKFGGTGLGLVISKNIVEKMDGRIWVESEIDVGSTFTFEIKLERVPHQNRIIFDGIRPEDIKLLIVESDNDVRNRFLSITENLGMKADSAANEKETLTLLETNESYDIIFLDYDISGINGIDLLNQINGKIDRNTVIIITTHLAWHRIERSAYENKVTRYITKPIFPSSVLDAINDVVGTKLKSLDIKTIQDKEVPDLSGANIILAEDVAINQEIFLALLEDTKISIDLAENGMIAVEKFKENPDKYDLIIMDVQMPEMDGYHATRMIRALEDIPKAKTIPIIAMTANAFKEDIETCLESGMNDHLAKPIDEKIVIEKIVRYIKK